MSKKKGLVERTLDRIEGIISDRDKLIAFAFAVFALTIALSLLGLVYKEIMGNYLHD
ncbi:MAG: hypothetical protein AAF333_04890 [Planctomycetota bacterium]